MDLVDTCSNYKNAQHSEDLTGETLRVFRYFTWLQADSDKIALSRPAHQQMTLTVGGRPGFMSDVI